MLVERFARAVVDDGLDVDSLLVITYTDRAAGELRARIRAPPARARTARSRARPRRRLDLDDPRLLPPAAHRLPARRRHRSSLPRARRGAGAGAAGRGLQRRAGGVLRRRRARPLAAARDLQCRAACARCSSASTTRCGRPGCGLVLEPGVRESLDDADRGAASPRPRRSPPTRRRPNCSEAAARDVARPARDDPACRSVCSSFPRPSARGARAAAFNDARTAVRALALEELASRDRELLQELLTGFAAAYAAAKDRESALDFEDLQLRARKLLRDNEAIREVEQLRFRSIMVDEFQDTNSLQTELIDLLCAGAAEGAVLRRRRVPVDLRLPPRRRRRVPRPARGRAAGAAADPQLPLAARGARRRQRAVRRTSSATASSRSSRRPATATRCSGRRSSCSSPTRRRTPTRALHWRRAEARHVARRVRELVDAGAATPGEIVLLFAAGTDAEWFEEELRALDLPTIRMTGRRYFGQQQVVDLLSLPAAAAEPLRRRGAAHRARLAVRRRLERRARPDSLHRRAAPDLQGHRARAARPISARTTGASCARSCSATSGSSRARRGSRSSCSASASSSSTTTTWPCSRVATASAATRTCASSRGWRGRTRSCAGPNIEGFIRFVAEQEAAGARERDAVSEEEGADAVRLLTIHAAKGLEFKVVVVADAGRERSRTDEILCLSDGRFGFKVAHPGHGLARRHDLVRGRQGDAGPGGGSGAAAPLLRRDDAGDGAADRLGLGRPLERARRADADRLGAAATRARRGARPRRRCRPGRGRARHRRRRAADRPLRCPPEQACARCAGRAGGRRRRGGPARALRGRGGGDSCRRPRGCASSSRSPCRRSPASRASRTARSRSTTAAGTATTPSAIVGMRPAPWEARDAGGDGEAGLHPTEIGDAVHRLLELVDLAAPAAPDCGRARGARARLVPDRLGRRAGADRRARRARTPARRSPTRIADAARSPSGATVRLRARRRARQRAARRALARRRARARARLQDERAPRPRSGGDRRRGVPDAADRVRDRLPARRSQGGRGRLPLPRGCGRASSRRSSPPTTRERLEAALSASIARIRAGEFRPTPSAFACSGCPGARRRLRRASARRRRRGSVRARVRRGRVAWTRAGRRALRHPRQPPGARGGARGASSCEGGVDRDRRRRRRASGGRAVGVPRRSCGAWERPSSRATASATC